MYRLLLLFKFSRSTRVTKILFKRRLNGPSYTESLFKALEARSLTLQPLNTNLFTLVFTQLSLVIVGNAYST